MKIDASGPAEASRHFGWLLGLREVAIVLGIYVAYSAVRSLSGDEVAAAVSNAERLVRWERQLGISWELAVQSWATSRPLVVHVANFIYFWLHLPMLAVFGFWMFLRNREQFIFLRAVWVVTQLIGLAFFYFEPVAPPRLLPSFYGFADTLTQQSFINYSTTEAGILMNKFAAFPSLHLAWSIIMAVGFYRTFGWRWAKLLALTYPGISFWSIVATGNHFIVDGIAGGLLAGLSFLVVLSAGRLTASWKNRGVACQTPVAVTAGFTPKRSVRDERLRPERRLRVFLSNPWISRGLLVLICLLPVLLYLPFLGTPFERDEGVYATIAEGIFNEKVPYRDLFDNKPPLVYIWYFLSFVLFGENVIAPRIVACAFLALTTLSLFGFARLAFGREVARLAATVFAVSTGLPFVSLHANTEAFLLLPLVVALLAFAVGMRRDRLLWFFVAGAASGLAIMTKQVAVWNLLALLIAALWLHRGAKAHVFQRAAPAVCLLAGSVVSTGLVALPFAIVGAAQDFFYANFLYNVAYLWILSGAQRAFILTAGGLYGLFFIVAAAPLVIGSALGLLALLRVRAPLDARVFILWSIALGLGVATGGRFYPHYFMAALPAMAVLTGVAIHHRFMGRRLERPARLTILACVFALTVSFGTVGLLYFRHDATERQFSQRVYQQNEWAKSSEELASYLAQHTGADDEIFNYGRESQLYFYAHRTPASRYFYDYAYTYDEHALQQTLDVLRQDPPEYIVDSMLPPLFRASDRSPEFEEFLRERYTYVGTFHFAELYQLETGAN